MTTEKIKQALDGLMSISAHVRSDLANLANDADEELAAVEQHVMALEQEIKILKLENEVYAALMAKMRAAVDEALGMNRDEAKI